MVFAGSPILDGRRGDDGEQGHMATPDMLAIRDGCLLSCALRFQL